MTKILRTALLIILAAAFAAPAALCKEQAATQTVKATPEESSAISLKYRQQCQEALEAGDPDKAMSIITEGLYKVQEGKDKADILSTRALIYYRLGKKDDAFKDLSTAILSASGIPSPYETRGMIDFDSGDYPLAIADLEHAIQLGSKDPATFTYRGNLYLMRNDPRSALLMYGRALEFSPDYWDAVFQSGYAYSRMGLIKKAADQYQEYINKFPDNAFAHNNMGIMAGQLGLIEVSISEFTTAVKENPRFASAWSNLGYTFFEKGDLDAALDAYGKAEEAEKNDPYPLCNHAEAYVHQGLTAKARGAIKKCLKSADSDPDFKSGEAYYLRTMDYIKSIIDDGKPLPTYDEAMAAAQKALDANDRVTAYMNYSIAYMLEPDTEAALYGLGLCAYRLGRYPRAVSFLTPYLGMYPSGPHAADITAMLKKIAPESDPGKN